MIKVITIIGARPQIIKSSAISRIIKNVYSEKITEIIIHTGQHYDKNMSEVFIEELDIPQPKYNLEVGSGAHGVQTAKMIEGIEEILIKEKPNYLIVYGDTNSTLAGAIAASKLHIPIVHIEAGLRSYNKKMPEEINRILTDHSSTYLFTPTEIGINNLISEGYSTNNKPPFTIDNPLVKNVGDIMYDNSIYFSNIENKTKILEQYNLSANEFILCTIHRDLNTDNDVNLNNIFKALYTIADVHQTPIIIPLHPRTKKKIESLNSDLIQSCINHTNIQVTEPVSFLEMIQLEKNSKMIITDSGGIQKEAYFFKKPCIILREETEWREIVESNAAYLCGADTDKILSAFEKFKVTADNIVYSNFYGDGNAADKIINSII